MAFGNSSGRHSPRRRSGGIARRAPARKPDNAALARRQTGHAELRATIAEIGNTVISSLDITDVYPRFAELLRRIIPWDRVVVNSLEPGGASYRERFAAGIAVTGRQPGDVVRVRGTFSEKVVQGRGPVSVSLPDDDAAALALAEFPGLKPEINYGFRSFLSTPLLSREGVIGTFHVRTLQPGTYTEEHVQLIQQVAAHLATAIANADLHARLAKESEEKSHIAQLGRIVSSSVQLRSVLPDFMQELKYLFPVDRLVIAVQAQDNDDIEDKYILGTRVPGWDDTPRRSLPNLLSRRTMRQKKGVLVPSREIAEADPADQPGFVASYAIGLKSAMAAPLISGGRVIGTLNVKAAREDAYTAYDLEVLERVAQQVAGSVLAAENYEQALAAAIERERRVRAEAQRENLEREAREKSRFITQVGHELRTPLTTMLAFADILRRNREGNLREGQLEKLMVMQRNGRRLAVLIDDLLDLSRIENGSYVLQCQGLDVATFVREAVKDLKPGLAARKQKLSIKTPRRPVSIYADSQRLTQVLSSLISNASSYSPDGSAITVSVTALDGSVEIAVTDSGIGIAPGEQDEVFKLFYRVDNEKTRSVPGTGIGLYVAKTLVEAHGGTVRVDPEHRGGARLVVRLPEYGGDSGEQVA